jgi:hypothetical protein
VHLACCFAGSLPKSISLSLSLSPLPLFVQTAVSPLVLRRGGTQGELCFPVHFPGSFCGIAPAFPRRLPPTDRGRALSTVKAGRSADSRGWRADAIHHCRGVCVTTSTRRRRRDGAGRRVVVRAMLVRGDISCQTETETRRRP